MVLQEVVFGLLVVNLIGAAFCTPNQRKLLDLDAHFEAMDTIPPMQQRIIGGEPVAEDEYVPYQISMQYLTKKGVNRHFCGGSIISSDRILTAAHCIYEQDIEKISVLGGVNSLNQTGTRSQVVKYVTHEDYKELEKNDIAILQIDPPLPLGDSEHMTAIKYQGHDVVDDKERVLLTGWGSIYPSKYTAKIPNQLHKLDYITMSNEKCKKKFKQILDSNICAVEKYGKGACFGDSGGPLVSEKDGEPYQVGVVSYGTSHCAINQPDVYTRVSSYIDWIEEQVKNESEE